MSQITYPAVFNGYDLTTVSGLTVLSADAYKPAIRSLSASPIARTNISRHNSAFYTDRTITVKVSITRANRDLLETSIDNLMNMLQGINKILKLGQSGTFRNYYCTLIDTPVAGDGGSYIEISLVFSCSDRFGYNISQDTLLSVTSARTSQSYSDRLTFGGSAPTQAPVIRLTFSAITGGTNKAISVGNGQTGQVVVITRTWAAGDVIEIDCFNKTVKVNNAEVAFTGAIPEWANGDANPFGYWSYFDTLTTRSWTGNITYYKRYD